MNTQADLPLSSALTGYRELLVAFSGGLDSTVLLHSLARLADASSFTLRAIHIHHGISPYADEWVAHCERVCQGLKVPLIVEWVTLEKEGLGIEAHARKARYAAFARHLQKGEGLVTAQHQNDQCETLLLALKRGSGPGGLAAMPETLAFAQGTIIRPMLGLSRSLLERYAAHYQLRWVEDDSNQDDSYDRNFLRLRIVPALEARWPHFASAAARSAALCGEQEALIDELLAEDLGRVVDHNGSLLIAPLLEMSEGRRAALIRRWLAGQGAQMPSRNGLLRLWQEVALSREDANPILQLGDHEIRRFQGALWRIATHKSQRDVSISWINPKQPLILPDNLGQVMLGSAGLAVRQASKGEAISIRFSASGNIHIVGRDRSRPMKKLWQALNIPSWQRDATPLLFYGEQLIAACGIFVTLEGQPDCEECWHIDWQKESKQC